MTRSFLQVKSQVETFAQQGVTWAMRVKKSQFIYVLGQAVTVYKCQRINVKTTAILLSMFYLYWHCKVPYNYSHQGIFNAANQPPNHPQYSTTVLYPSDMALFLDGWLHKKYHFASIYTSPSNVGDGQAA